MFKKCIVQTSFGLMTAIADEHVLYLLQFSDSCLLDKQVDHIQKLYNVHIVQGSNSLIEKLEKELASYCSGKLQTFTITLSYEGTRFQKKVWDHCSEIEYGGTVSYQRLAGAMGNSLACRAVGTALGSNCYVIIVPCHRVIKSDGKIGHYGGGVERKIALLAHEQLFKNKN